MPFVHIKHPLALHKLSHMRRNSAECPSRMFTQLMREIGMVMASEVMRHLFKASATRQVIGASTDTDGVPAVFESEFLEAKKPIMVPILRSALVMAQGMQELISTSFMGHLGIYHDEEEAPVCYLSALPELEPDRYFMVIDPVIATGETACLAIQLLKDYDVAPNRIVFVSLIIGDAGQLRLEQEHPDVTVFGIKIGEAMDGKRVQHGLGSVSDRQFRTI